MQTQHVVARSQTGCVKCVKSGRPVILTTVFADCGRFSKCVFIHLREYFWCTEILVQIFKDTCFCVFVIDWALFPLNRSVSVRFGTDTPAILVQRSFHLFFFSDILELLWTTTTSFSIPSARIRSFIYCKVNRMGSFFLMYTVYKCTMSIFLWCPTTICIRNGQ